jgi:hypothetical protein
MFLTHMQSPSASMREGAHPVSMSVNYSSLVQVNGYSCRSCTDVDYAKKHIDPAHPKSGPYDINAASDPTRCGETKKAASLSPIGCFLDISV